ncbi:MAG: glycosyltransferase family 2 protein [Vicinamibacterales bacterium]
MNALEPRVSVGLPVYNGDTYLQNTLERLLQQDFENFELVICDNASTDRTQEICRDFAARDRRIRYHRNERNLGLAVNHNRTFELARGQFFKWAAHDDDFPKRMLLRFVQAFDELPPNVAVVYSRCEYIDEFGSSEWVDSDHVDLDDPRPHKRLAQMLWNIHMYNCNYGLIRSDMLRRTRLFGKYPMSDHVLFAELAILGRLVELPEALLRIRRHPGRTFTATQDPKKLRELFDPGRGDRFMPLSMKNYMKLEIVRSGMLIPPTAKDKLLCTAVATVLPQWRTFKAFGGRQKQRLRRMWAT